MTPGWHPAQPLPCASGNMSFAFLTLTHTELCDLPLGRNLSQHLQASITERLTRAEPDARKDGTRDRVQALPWIQSPGLQRVPHAAKSGPYKEIPGTSYRFALRLCVSLGKRVSLWPVFFSITDFEGRKEPDWNPQAWGTWHIYRSVKQGKKTFATIGLSTSTLLNKDLFKNNCHSDHHLCFKKSRRNMFNRSKRKDDIFGINVILWSNNNPPTPIAVLISHMSPDTSL